jgi:hypothetical protein
MPAPEPHPGEWEISICHISVSAAKQRSVGLEFTQSPIINGHTWNVTAPADADIAPPGYYMLFVLRDKSHSSSGTTMIPSEAKIVRLS